MKITLYITLIMILSILSNNIIAQNIVITDDDVYTAESSAMLDIKATDKGMLIPRLTTLQRTSISNPASGLLVYDNQTNSFWFNEGAPASPVWVELISGLSDSLSSKTNIAIIADSDDNSSGDIKFSIGSNEKMVIQNNGSIGIGTPTPSTKLEIQVDAATDDPILELEQKNIAGDASIRLITNSGKTFSMGIDKSDSDKFKISENFVLGTNDRLTLLQNGSFVFSNSNHPFGADFYISFDHSSLTTPTQHGILLNIANHTAFSQGLYVSHAGTSSGTNKQAIIGDARDNEAGTKTGVKGVAYGNAGGKIGGNFVAGDNGTDNYALLATVSGNPTGKKYSGYFGGGAIGLGSISTTPPNPSASAEGNIYIKGDKLIIQYNESGTIRYKYLTLTGTGVTWTHTTTAP